MYEDTPFWLNAVAAFVAIVKVAYDVKRGEFF